jgi:hypothetical protein
MRSPLTFRRSAWRTLDMMAMNNPKPQQELMKDLRNGATRSMWLLEVLISPRLRNLLVD